MAVYKTVIELHNVSGLPEDDYVNTFHFQTNEVAGETDTAAAIGGHIAAAYNAIEAPGLASVASFLSPLVSRVNLPTIKTYDVEGGSPLATDTMAVLDASATASAFPPEVAICLSYRGDLTNIPEEAPDGGDVGAAPDRPRSRRRGRIYFGPLNTSGPSFITGRPMDTIRNALLGFGKFLGDPAAAALIIANATWVVYSKQEPGDKTTNVVQCSVDDDFDIQRRRGLGATSRLVQAVTQPA